jgi:hypothetical protein
MTSDQSEFAKFKKIAGDDKVSTFQEMDKEEVEGEILEAVKEAKSDVEIRQELDVILEETNTKKEPTTIGDINVKVSEGTSGREIGAAIRKELRRKTTPAPKKEVKKEVKKLDRKMVRALRKNDRHFNHTCAATGKRLPLEDFAKGKKSDVCIAQEGK